MARGPSGTAHALSEEAAPLIHRSFDPEKPIWNACFGPFVCGVLSTTSGLPSNDVYLTDTPHHPPPTLLEEVWRVLRLQHYAIHTERSWSWVVSTRSASAERVGPAGFAGGGG